MSDPTYDRGCSECIRAGLNAGMLRGDIRRLARSVEKRQGAPSAQPFLDQIAEKREELAALKASALACCGVAIR